MWPSCVRSKHSYDPLSTTRYGSDRRKRKKKKRRGERREINVRICHLWEVSTMDIEYRPIRLSPRWVMPHWAYPSWCVGSQGTSTILPWPHQSYLISFVIVDAFPGLVRGLSSGHWGPPGGSHYHSHWFSRQEEFLDLHSYHIPAEKRKGSNWQRFS